VWNDTIQYSTRSSRLSVHKLFTACIRRYLMSRTCDWVMSALSAALIIFSFQFSLLFFHIRRQAELRRIGFDTQHRTSDVAENVGRYLSCLSCTERIALENDFELILTVKMKTRYPVEVFGSEFPAICNHCAVMAAWSRKTFTFCEQFLRFV